MFNWATEKFSGERVNFTDFKVELDTQLRMKNVYLIASGRELLPVLPPQNVSASVLAKIMEKRDEYEHRNQLGFGLITMSVHKKLIYQLNRLPIQGCKEAQRYICTCHVFQNSSIICLQFYFYYFHIFVFHTLNFYFYRVKLGIGLY